jgi:AAA+ superfamily predicted ATPase
MEAYRTSLEHLLDEMGRIDLLIQNQIRRVRGMQPINDGLQGMYISDEEVDELLTRTAGMPRWASAETDGQEELDDLSSMMFRRKAQSTPNLIFRLDELTRLFHLSSFERDALLVCLAPEIDLRYERLYAYLQDDVTKKHPSVDLVLDLLCQTPESRLKNRQSFLAASPLVRYRLLQLYEDPAQSHVPLLGKFLKLDDHIANYLLDCDELHARIRDYAELIVPRFSLETLSLKDELKRYLKTVAQTDNILYLQGPGGVGKQSSAEAMCSERNLKLLLVNGNKFRNVDPASFETIIHLLLREAHLQNAALYWASFDVLLEDEHDMRSASLLAGIAEESVPTFLAGQMPWEGNQDEVIRVEFEKPDFDERVQLWSGHLAGSLIEIESVAGKFRLTGEQIKNAVRIAQNLARRRDPINSQINNSDVYAACRLLSNGKLSALAQKITAHYQWEDIILPPDRLEQLREICDQVHFRNYVYGEWGFDRKLSLGKGLNVLFAGPSGTGKTMAAEIISGELGLDLYKIDLSMVISKYIGETEKNLARIFDEAETSNAILFFDEADALFGKRSEVRDAHDRYANIETAYLLQKMEEYDGVVILATNLRRNMDDAFVRRMHFAVEFPFPTEHDRQRIWENIWPHETPLQPGLDLNLIAHRFELAGGNIRNIALVAAFFAASDGQPVRMTHLIRAIKREYQKMGKVVMDGEFSEYAPLGAL